MDRGHVLLSSSRAQALVAHGWSSFKEFPPRQKPASFNLDEVMVKMSRASGANK